eukprot:gene36856-45468_t
MATLNEKITALEAEIDGYVNDLKTASTEARKDLLLGTISSSRETLNRWMDERKAPSTGQVQVQFQQPVHVFSSLLVSRFEAELKLTGISVQTGLQPGGSRGFVLGFVNTMTGVLIDGFVQRIPIHDLKVVLRGTEEHVQFVIGQLRDSIDCDIQEIRYGGYHAWPADPRFKILGSATRKALKSDKSDDAFDNKSIRSKSSAGSA